MSNSHASTRLVDDVRSLRLPHRRGGAQAVSRQSPTSACQQARAASAAVSARRMRGPRPTAIASFMRRSAASSAASKPPSGPTRIAHGAVRAAAVERRQRLGDRRGRRRSRRTPAGDVCAGQSLEQARRAPPARAPRARSGARSVRPPRRHWRAAARRSPARRSCAASAPAAAAPRRARSPSRRCSRCAHFLTGAKHSHRSGSTACSRSRSPITRGAAFLAAQRQARRPFAVATVEQAQRRTLGAPHDVAQVVDLRVAERRLAFPQRARLDEEPRRHGV